MTRDCEEALWEAVKRAKVYQFFNCFTNTVYFISTNHKEPLTADESIALKHWIHARFPYIKVMFTVDKEEFE